MMTYLNQKGAVPIILVLGIIGITAIMFVANAAPFKDRFLSSLYPKDQSYAATTTTTKIMPVGDSLTHGVKKGSSDPENLMAGYRYYLYKNLTAAENQVDMVGNLSSGPSDLADRNHEGHNGYDCDMISNLIGSSASTYQPDVILLMCGVNDFAQPRTNQFKAEAINHLEKVINNISTSSPNTKIVVATIVDSNLGYVPDIQNQIKNFNAKIPALVAKKQTEGKNVYLVDMYNGLTLADLSDTVHPNEDGYQKMSDVWQNILKPILGNSNPWGIIANYSYIKPGAAQTVSWFNLSNNNNASWIGLYKADVPDSQIGGYVTWFYLGNCVNNLGTPTSSPKVGICTTQIPSNLAEGQYEFRLYLQGTTLAQKSNRFTLSSAGMPLVSPSPSAPLPSPSASAAPPISPSPSTQNSVSAVKAGSIITVSWQNLVGNNGASWIGLFKSSDPLTSKTTYKDWMYLGSCSRLSGTPISSPTSGSCNFPIPSGTESGIYEIRMFLQGSNFTSKSNQIQI